MTNINRQPVFLLSQSDIGAGKRGAAFGPSAVIREMERSGLATGETETLDNRSFVPADLQHPYGKNIDSIFNAMQSLNDKVMQIIAGGKFPYILSGDHSNAIGGLSGLKNAFPEKRVGVIWVDAHADLHSPYTTPSGNLHGMPLAALSGIDNMASAKNKVDDTVATVWKNLKHLGSDSLSPKFDIDDLVFIGIRSAEEEEWNIINNSRILAFTPDKIRQKGMEQVLAESLEHLAACDILYVSFDADSLDPSISTGTGTTAPDGLKMEQARLIFRTLLAQPKLGAFEITEVNPSLDTDGFPMAKVIAQLLADGLQSLQSAGN